MATTSLDRLRETVDERRRYYEDNPANAADGRLRLAALQRAEAELHLAITVIEARIAGLTWREVGRCLGVSTQAAQQRFTPLVSERSAVH